ncbi:MAG TPA: mechanosensitive ion channel family protein [Thermoanaerobaculia bacterium]|nr:mechanosensitive ion channel family protein [Thermoanaerobaculia bacterium]
MKSIDLLLDAPPSSAAIALAVTLFILLVAWSARALARRHHGLSRQTGTSVDDFLVDVVVRTKPLLLLFPAIYAGARVLPLTPELGRALAMLTRVSLVAQGAVWGVAVVEFALERYGRTRIESDPSAITTIRAFRFGAVIGVWIVAVLAALDNVGFDVTALIAGLGIGGVAIALATQNILGDLFASLSIVVDKPFVVGDAINIGEGDIGVVQHIGLKTTRIRSLSGEELVVSNGDLLRSRIRNYGRMPERRVVGKIGVTYQTPPDVLERLPGLIRAAVEQQEGVRFDRAHFMQFGESAYELELVYYVLTSNYGVFMDKQQAVNLAILRAFGEAGAEFAYPTRTLFVASGLGPQPEP